MAPKIKINLKERLEDGELDLSMSDLQEVPVKDIVALKKVTSLELSNNRLTTLGKNFTSMTFLVKLDLSKNSLKELPEDFGELKQLKHLDLYSNKLTHLPLSFGELKSLKWLDLKNNSLVPAVAKVAGPCLDSPQCMRCAKDIVAFFTQMKLQVEQEQERLELQQQQELEAQANLLKEEQKKKERKKQAKAKKMQKKFERKDEPVILHTNGPQLSNLPVKTKNKPDKKQPKKKSFTCWRALKYLILGTLFNCSLLFFLSAGKVPQVEGLTGQVVATWGRAVALLPPEFKSAAVQFGNYLHVAHGFAAKLIQDVSLFVVTTRDSEGFQNAMTKVTLAISFLAQESQKYFSLFGEKLLVWTEELRKKVL